MSKGSVAQGGQRRSPGGFAAWFVDRRIRTKILSVVAVMALTACTVGVVAFVKLTAVNAGTHAVAGNGAGLRQLAEAQRIATALRADLRDHILASGDKIVTFRTAIENDDKQLEDALARFEASGTATVADRAGAEKFRNAFGVYQKLRDSQVLPPSAAGDKAAAYKALTGEVVPVYKGAMSLLAGLMSQQVQKSETVQAQADADYRTARITLTTVVALGLALSLGLGVVVTRTITTPLRRVDDVLLALARGDLTQRADIVQNDEIGEMARALQTATEGIRVSVQAMASSARTMTQATAELAAGNGQIATMAAQTSEQANAMSITTQQLTDSVELVAAGTEEMGSSIRQIALDADQAARLGGEAVHRVQEANATVTELGDSSIRIGQVLNLISSIAEQTNLLALNATIEAARAGEAGKGFAVVAGEVKDLAGETARATGDIEEKVRDIQSGTAGAVGAMSSVTADMERINGYQTSIAGAVEQQSATSAEIVRNVTEAAVGSRGIADHVAGIAEAAQVTSVGVQRNQEAADRLASLSNELREAVARFQY